MGAGVAGLYGGALAGLALGDLSLGGFGLGLFWLFGWTLADADFGLRIGPLLRGFLFAR